MGTSQIWMLIMPSLIIIKSAKGILKIMNKIESQLCTCSSDFEILGLNKTFLVNIFLTPSRIEGIGLTEIEKVKKDIKKLFLIQK
jgi:hypothetical protein